MATTEATGTGVSFELTGEQRALRELAHEFAEKEIRPKAADYDEHQTHPAAVIAKAPEGGGALRERAHEFAEKEIRPKGADYDQHQAHPADVIAKAHEVGLMNPHVPEALGGRRPG